MSDALAHANIYTEEDYYNLPETVRAELIDGQIYYMADPGKFLGALIFRYKLFADFLYLRE